MASPGTYFGIPKGGLMDTTKKGTAYLAVTVQITHRLDGTEWQEIEPIIARVPVFLSEKAWPTARKKLQVMGFKGDFQSPQFDCPNGLQFRATVNEGYTNWDLVDWSDGGSREATAPAASELLRLNARWKQESGGTPPPSSPPTAPAPVANTKNDWADEGEKMPWEK